MYAFLTVRKLQGELRKRNASVAGKKGGLIERLEAYDRNQNFGGNFEIAGDPVYVAPPSSAFRDINANSPVPNVSNYEIQEYFQRFNTHPNGQALYESRHLITARYVSDTSFVYLRGQCKASMKKLVYVVDVKVNHQGAIEECHCECAAGSGTSAHCKHVALLLLAAHDVVNKKTIILHQACTQQLMTFKAPKKVFNNSPIAAHRLQSKRASCNYEPLNENQIMENYLDYVRNLAIGYGESSMPILQTYEPANPHAMENDHPYSKQTAKERLLEKLHLINLSIAQINDIEERTRLQDDSSEWHELWKCRITASLMYVVSHSTAKGQKAIIKKIISPKDINTRAVTHGKVQERVAISQYEEQYGINVRKCGLVISQECPYLAASPDGLIGEETVLEVKCPYSARYKEINEKTVCYLERIEGTLCLKKNHPYFAQIQGQLYCTVRKYCNFIVYTFKEMTTIFINRDDGYISEMLTGLMNFYLHHLEPAIVNKYIYRDYIALIKNKNN